MRMKAEAGTRQGRIGKHGQPHRIPLREAGNCTRRCQVTREGVAMVHRILCLLVAGHLLAIGASTGPAQQPEKAKPDPLPSWNDGPARKAILEFVRATTDKASPKYVPVAARIATFDNDGTLWPEQPLYAQLAFALDRVKALAPRLPDWKA